MPPVTPYEEYFQTLQHHFTYFHIYSMMNGRGGMILGAYECQRDRLKPLVLAILA